MASSSRSENLFRYLRIQTTALLSWWAGLMFLEWGKPGLVSNGLRPTWLLLAAVVSATITALCLPAALGPQDFPHRRLVALIVAAIVGGSVALVTAADFGLLAGLVVGGSLAAMLKRPSYRPLAK